MIIAILMLIFAHILATYTAYKNSDVGPFFDEALVLGVYTPVVFNIRLIIFTILLFTYHIA